MANATISKKRKPRQTRGRGVPVTGDRYMNAAALASRWGVSLPHVYDLTAQGVIPCLRLGGVVRFAIEEIEKIESASLMQSANAGAN